MKVLITGVSGSLGKIVSDKMLAAGHDVIGFSRDEYKQQMLPTHPALTLYLGDVRNRDRLMEASRGVDVLFHFAALKHVDKLEENPEECVLTNIIGTENVLHSQRLNHIPRVVLSSTDKAVYPVNTYGMSKGIAERLVLRNKNNVVCRYGNVLASRGSVVEKFVKTLKSGGYVDITDPNMYRFWITLEEASEFVISNAFSTNGGLKIPSMRACPIQLLHEVVADCLRINSYEVRNVGVRPGEKFVECLRSEFEGEEVFSNKVSMFTREQLKEMVLPMVKDLS